MRISKHITVGTKFAEYLKTYTGFYGWVSEWIVKAFVWNRW
jgi:hypothetical protein